MEQGREAQSFLDRPVRSLLDLKIGTVLKACFEGGKLVEKKTL